MNLTEAKTELKKKGYSIRTTYTPKQDKIEINILKSSYNISEYIGYPDECEEFLIMLNKQL